jgi:hypothetical protein
MAAPKCGSCKHYSKQTGCALERQSYGLYRNCVLGNHDLHEPISSDACGAGIENLPTLAEIMEHNRKKVQT